jgi:hypothetical protein
LPSLDFAQIVVPIADCCSCAKEYDVPSKLRNMTPLR